MVIDRKQNLRKRPKITYDYSDGFYLSEFRLKSAHIPVKWHSWGDEAIQKAKNEDWPIFLSIGCSSSHWCYVMDEEFINNELLVKMLQKEIVCIKVDRDQRPDVAKEFMTFLQYLEDSDIWIKKKRRFEILDMPFNVFLTSDLKPLTCASYYPPRLLEFDLSFYIDKRKWKEVMMGTKWGAVRFDNYFDALYKTATQPELPLRFPEKACAEKLVSDGFGSAFKFSRLVDFHLMLCHSKVLMEEEAKKFLELVESTLKHIARCGIHDHIGGGFHRIGSPFRKIVDHQVPADEFPPVPHFEKMLYDQGQLANVYLSAFAITEDLFYSRVSRDILDFLRGAMKGGHGGFFSAVDAGSANSKDGEEGTFYQWTIGELEHIDHELGCHANTFKCHYKFLPLWMGKHVLIEAEPSIAVTSKFDGPDYYIMGKCREILSKFRSRKPSPNVDETVLVSWNGLVISSFARASKILRGEPEGTKYYFPVSNCDPEDYLQVAEEAAGFILKLYKKNEHGLFHSFWEAPSNLPGFLDDYAFLISGLLDLYEFGGGVSWLKWAAELQTLQDHLFLDHVGGAYYSTTMDHGSVIHRVKEYYDGAVPSGNSVSAINLVRLASMFETKREEYTERAKNLLANFETRLKDGPTEAPLMCCAAEMLAVAAKRILVVIFHRGPCVELNDMLAAAHASYNPNRTVIHLNTYEAKDVNFWKRRNFFIWNLLLKYNSYHRRLRVSACIIFVDQPYDHSQHFFTNPSKLKHRLSNIHMDLVLHDCEYRVSSPPSAGIPCESESEDSSKSVPCESESEEDLPEHSVIVFEDTLQYCQNELEYIKTEMGVQHEIVATKSSFPCKLIVFKGEDTCMIQKARKKILELRLVERTSLFCMHA